MDDLPGTCAERLEGADSLMFSVAEINNTGVAKLLCSPESRNSSGGARRRVEVIVQTGDRPDVTTHHDNVSTNGHMPNRMTCMTPPATGRC